VSDSAGYRSIFYTHYEPIAEENESKLSSEDEIRTDVSNTDESFELDFQPNLDFCDEPETAEDTRADQVMHKSSATR
jgi:hypothetical protein